MNDPLALAKLRLEELLTYFGINTKVKAEKTEDMVELKVAEDTGGRLIGRHGQTLRAIQYLVNMMVRAGSDEHVFVSVDIADYKKGREERLTEQAKSSAQKAIETGKNQILAPMTAAERRIIHMVLSDQPGVVTESIGEDPRRRVVIKKR